MDELSAEQIANDAPSPTLMSGETCFKALEAADTPTTTEYEKALQEAEALIAAGPPYYVETGDSPTTTEDEEYPYKNWAEIKEDKEKRRGERRFQNAKALIAKKNAPPPSVSNSLDIDVTAGDIENGQSSSENEENRPSFSETRNILRRKKKSVDTAVTASDNEDDEDGEGFSLFKETRSTLKRKRMGDKNTQNTNAPIAKKKPPPPKKNNKAKPIRVTYLQTKKTKEFKTITIAAGSLGVGRSRVSRALQDNAVLDNKYSFQFLEDDKVPDSEPECDLDVTGTMIDEHFKNANIDNIIAENNFKSLEDNNLDDDVPNVWLIFNKLSGLYCRCNKLSTGDDDDKFVRIQHSRQSINSDDLGDDEELRIVEKDEYEDLKQKGDIIEDEIKKTHMVRKIKRLAA